MPPAWSPNKQTVTDFDEKQDEKIKLELGFVTPPNMLQSNIIPCKTVERGEQHKKEILQKCPKLASLFHLHKKIGEGTFSAVFMASLKNDEEKRKRFAVKWLVPTTHPKRIQIELNCLQEIGGQDNVVGVDLCLRENENIVFIMPYLQHGHFSEYVLDMDVEETISYIKNLLIALQRVHSFGVIHRDVKPSNFLYDRINKKFLLVDFGLAQVCSKNMSPINVSTCTNTLKRKRDSSNETNGNQQTSDINEPTAKRPALQNKNINSLNSTVKHLQASFNKHKQPVLQSKENFQQDLKQICQQLSSPFRGPKSPDSKKNMTSIALKYPLLSSPFKGFNKPSDQVSNMTDLQGFKSPVKKVGKPQENKKFHIPSSPYKGLKSPVNVVSTTKLLKSPFKFTGLDLPPTHSKFQGKMPGQRRLFMDNEEPPKPIKFSKPLSAMTITTRNPFKALSSVKTQQELKQDCKCFNKATVCSICLLKKGQEAPRAGTPGFRPPEVLLKYQNQTTAVDIWAVGVILLCILSGCYPFFRAPNDITALAEIITLFGDEQMKKVAKLLGRHLNCTEKKPLDIRNLCYKLRRREIQSQNTCNKKCDSCRQFENNCLCSGVTYNDCEDDKFPDSAYDLLKRLLDLDPYTRISAEEALKHPFLN